MFHVDQPDPWQQVRNPSGNEWSQGQYMQWGFDALTNGSIDEGLPNSFTLDESDSQSEGESLWLTTWMTAVEDPSLLQSLFVPKYDLANSSSWPVHPIAEETASEEEEAASDTVPGQEEIADEETTASRDVQLPLAVESTDADDLRPDSDAEEAENLNAEPDQHLQDAPEGEGEDAAEVSCQELYEEQRKAHQASCRQAPIALPLWPLALQYFHNTCVMSLSNCRLFML